MYIPNIQQARHTTFLFLLWLPMFTLANETNLITHYNTLNGLAHNLVHCITQDNSGFMWFGTDNGVSRFDGYDFVNYYAQPHTNNSLSGKEVSDIVIEPTNNTIWLATISGGLNKLDPNTQVITSYTHNNDDIKSIRSNHILSLYLTNNNQLWVGTNKGLDLYHPDSDTFSHIDILYALGVAKRHIVIHDILQIKNRLWLGTDDGLITYNIDNENVTLIFPTENKHDNRDILALYHSRDNKLWVGTGRGLFIVDTDLRLIENYDFIYDYFTSLGIRSISENNQGEVWIATNDGAYQIHHSLKHIRAFKSNPHANGTLNDNDLITLYIDKEQNIWFGSFLGGVNKLSAYSSHFNLKRQLITQNKLQDNNIRYVYEDDDNNIWLLNNTAIQRYNPQTNTYDNPMDHINKFNEEYFEDIYTIAGFQNEIWISTESKGLFQYSINGNSIKHYQYKSGEPNSLNSNHIHGIFPDGERLWIDSLKSLLIYNPSTKQFNPINILNQIESYKITGNVYDIYTDHHGYTWIASYYGLSQFKDKQLIKHHYHQAGQLQSLRDNTVYDIEADNTGQLWIVNSTSLLKYNYESNTFEPIIHDDFPEGSVIYSLLSDQTNKLWLGTNKGLAVFDPTNNTIINFHQSDGLQGEDYFHNSKLLTGSGQLVFGGVGGGFNIIDPEQALKSSNPSIYITRLDLNNNVYNHYTHQTIQLNNSEHKLSLTLSTLSYHNPQSNHYAYKLEELHDRWIELDSKNRKITINNLDPGQYTLKVRARFNTRPWSEEKQLLKIDVSTPWWLSIYAYLVYSLIIFSFIYALIQMKTYKLQKKSIILEQQVVKRTEKIQQQKSLIEKQNENLKLLIEKKDKIFTSISHEFRTPLTLIIGPLKKLLSIATKTQQNSINIIQSNAFRLLRLVDQLLDLSKLHSEAHSINSSSSYSNQLVKAIFPSFQTLATNKQITLTLTDNDLCLLSCSHDSLEKIITNLLSNAIKYTLPESHIELSVTKINDRACQITVKDTGIGIPSDQINHIFETFVRVENQQHHNIIPGTGIGLALVRELVESHHGNILVESKLGQGSCFTITFPLSDNAQDP